MNDNNKNIKQNIDDNNQKEDGLKNISNDERDSMIKNEEDTARIRSERQSVIDGENKKEEQH